MHPITYGVCLSCNLEATVVFALITPREASKAKLSKPSMEDIPHVIDIFTPFKF